MKLKIFILCVLLTMLLGLAACGEDPVPAPAAAVTTLVPYTNDDLGISSVVPDGWAEVKPGQFQPTPGSDPTLLGQVVFPGATVEQVADSAGFPESTGTMETADLTWDLYNVELDWPDAGTLVWDVALAQGDAGVYGVLLVTLAAERDPLHDAVFLPAVGALAPAPLAQGEAPARTPPPAPAPTPVDTRVRAADGMVMVYVPAGQFDMGHAGTQWIWGGSLRDGDLRLQVFTDEQPRHSVYLDAFWIDRTEVTVAMFRTFVQATGYRTTAEKLGWGHPWTEGPIEDEWPRVAGTDWQHPRGPESSAQDDHPVVQVSWEDADAYCEWAGGGLPTEAQWEKAARGNDGRTWPWGNTYDGARGNFCDARCPVERWKQDRYDDGYAFTAPVGSFPGGASPYGALDMAGNVWEWVADWYDSSYSVGAPTDNPSGPRFGTERAMRGGAWIDNEPWVRATVRYQNPPTSRCDDVGFRCAVPAR